LLTPGETFLAGETNRSAPQKVAKDAGQLLDHEADLIGALAADERAALTRFLAKLERFLT
jgi:hypothetical protein